MKKDIIIAIVGILLIAAGWYARDFIYPQTVGGSPSSTQASSTPDGTLCAQVITSARNPATGDIKEFPTPCDVPDGWEVIQNDEPGL